MLSKNKIKFLAIITARGGSRGIPKKNIKKLAGKPLIKYTIDAAKNSKLLDKIIVSTDSKEIANFCKKQGVEVPFLRPKYLATNTAKSLDVLLHAIKYLEKFGNYKPDYIVTLQPTSPLRTNQDINNAIKLILKDKKADSLVSVIGVVHNFNPAKLMKLRDKYLIPYLPGQGTKILSRKKLPKIYARNGPAILISKYETIIKKKGFYGKKILPYFMPKEKSIDIDDVLDWKMTECLIKNK